MKKKGQVELTFNWIYVALAGAIILLFFVGIVIRQAKVSEEQLSGEVVRILDSILSGASVSEKTKNSVEAGGLSDYVIYFDCNEGVGEFGLKGKPARMQNSIDPLFAPKEIQSSFILFWSLPYHLPFKVIDFLFVTAPNVKYYLVGNDEEFVNEFLDSTAGLEQEGFNREYVADLNDLKAEGKIKVRVVDVDGLQVPEKGIPAGLNLFSDEDVSAIAFIGGTNLANFYQKEGNLWKKLNKEPVEIISLDEERNAAKYAAIFTESAELYTCNMKKAFDRLEILTEVYGGEEIAQGKIGGKLKQMVDFYKNRPASSECIALLLEYKSNAKDALRALNTGAAGCRLELGFGESPLSCAEIISVANELGKINEDLRINCVQLY
ncbi:MAG: hypothetical protein AABW48_05630 [Nanoarchaeota archaeon]